MYTVLVVDDDPLLCNALRLKIDIINQESSLDISVILIANSAPEATSVMENTNIDILITDVQMPYQSGLELIELTVKKYPSMQLVVLSGYSYYEYMRSAMHSGVVDYLLKPVKLGQLKEILLKCIENIKSSRDSQENINLRKRQTLDYRLEKYLNSLQLGHTGDVDFSEEFSFPYFYVAIFSIQNQVQFAPLFDMFQKEKDGASIRSYHIHDTRQSNVLLINTASSDSLVVQVYLEEFCAFAVSRGMDCHCATSLCGNSLEDYHDLHKQSRHALSYQLIEHFSVKMAKKIEEQDFTRYSSELFQKYIRRIQSAFQSRNFELITTFINEIFTYQFFRDSKATLADIRNFFTYYLSQAQEVASSFHMDFDDPRHFSSFLSLDEIRIYFKEILYRLQQQSDKETDKTQYVISTAIKYIEDNYNLDINMNDAAAAVNMSYTYFSKFFKEETHQSFSEYVATVRMREAKRLLEEDPSIKIKDVASLVGYESVYSFSRAFKQYYNVPPKQLR